MRHDMIAFRLLDRNQSSRAPWWREVLRQRVVACGRVTRSPRPSAMADSEADSRLVEGRITSKLEAAFSPTHLEVLNESDTHNVPRGSETHFKVIVVSEGFAGVGPLDRHRLVNGTLADELSGCRCSITPSCASHPRASRSLAPSSRRGVHALSIVAKTPAQWAKASHISPSPPCLGGSNR